MAKYYVDPVSGSDAAAGTSFVTAWKTTAYAVSQAIQDDIIALCATGIETLTATITWSAKRLFLVGHSATGTNDGTMYQVRGPAGGSIFSGSGASNLVNIELLLDGTTPYAPIEWVGGGVFLHKCKSIGTVNYFAINAEGGDALISLSCCDIRNISSSIFFHSSANRRMLNRVSSCYIKNCTSFFGGGLQNPSGVLASSIIINTGINTNLYTAIWEISNCIFWNSEILIGDRDSANLQVSITNSVLAASTNSGEAAIRWWSTANNSAVVIDNCLFYGNTNDTLNAPASFFLGPGCITGVDPGFTDPANDDFSYGSTSPLAGAGALGVG